MIVLNQTTDKIQVVLAGAKTTNELQCTASFRDILYGNKIVSGRTLVNTNGATDVDLVGSPGALFKREIDFLSVYNKDTVSQTVTLKFDANATEFILIKAILAAGEQLQYSKEGGFQVISSNGGIKGSAVAGSNSAVDNVILGADVVNSADNTLADVTGLSFPVVSGETYWFEFVIPYSAAATTTGSRWTINAPTTTLLNYKSTYPLDETTGTMNHESVKEKPDAANASSLAAGNVATIQGIITPSADGTVIARFASEVNASAITAKAGAILRWMRII